MSITAEQARTIADVFLEASKSVDEYLDENFNKIDRPEYEFLNESFKTLMRVATFATTVAVDLSIDALEDPVTELKTVIERTKEKIRVLQNIGRVIRLVAGLTDLAGGIMARDPRAIVTSLTNLNEQLNM